MLVWQRITCIGVRRLWHQSGAPPRLHRLNWWRNEKNRVQISNTDFFLSTPPPTGSLPWRRRWRRWPRRPPRWRTRRRSCKEWKQGQRDWPRGGSPSTKSYFHKQYSWGKFAWLPNCDATPGGWGKYYSHVSVCQNTRLGYYRRSFAVWWALF